MKCLFCKKKIWFWQKAVDKLKVGCKTHHAKCLFEIMETLTKMKIYA